MKSFHHKRNMIGIDFYKIHPWKKIKCIGNEWQVLTCFCSNPVNDEGLKDNNSGRENRNQGHDFDDANGGNMALTVLAWAGSLLSQTLSVE